MKFFVLFSQLNFSACYISPLWPPIAQFEGQQVLCVRACFEGEGNMEFFLLVSILLKPFFSALNVLLRYFRHLYTCEPNILVRTFFFSDLSCKYWCDTFMMRHPKNGTFIAFC